MKINYISHIIKGDVMGDPFNAYELSVRQSLNGDKVNLITWNKKNKPLYEKINNNFNIYRLDGIDFALKPFFYDYPFILNLKDVLINSSPDVIHAHSHLFLPTYSSIMIAHHNNIPSIVNIHGVYAERDFIINNLQYIYIKTFSKRVLDICTYIICLTKNDASQLSKIGNYQEKIRIVPNAVNTEIFFPEYVNYDEKQLIWTGRFVPEKGLSNLIKIGKNIVKFDNNVKILLIGDGPSRDNINNLIIANNLSNNIRILSSMNHIALSKVLRQSNIFLFTSIKEGMPNSILEAMASGKCVVAFKISGLDEIIKDGYNGYLIDNNNIEEFTNIVIMLLKDENIRINIGKNARNTIELKYNWDIVLKKINHIYQEARAM